jgi:tRNA(Ile)-lysidine synthase
MIEELKEFIDENKLIDKSDRVLLAVSGGIDSMVMAHLFVELKADIGIAHCNFSLRGRESDGDEELVKQFALAHKIPFYSVKFETKKYASENHVSIQMAARDLRYKWFEEIRVKHNYSLISVAHNLNDNVETFLLNLTRGTGIAGLTGMKPRYNCLIRPLLFASRNNIAGYCKENNINFREDKSNADTKYIRNKIRHSIIPKFLEINPSFEKTIIETSERLNEINEIITDHINKIRNEISTVNGDTIAYKIKSLKGLSPKLTMLFELFRPYGIGKGQLEDLVNLIDGKTGTQLITFNYRLFKNRNELVVSKKEESSENDFEIASIEDFVKFPNCVTAHLEDVTSAFRFATESNIACLDADKVSFPMIIRKWKHGDSFFPLGMKKRKKLSDYFIDKKYSVLEKEQCMILEAQGMIVWLINDRIDNRFRITKSTKKVLTLKFEYRY